MQNVIEKYFRSFKIADMENAKASAMWKSILGEAEEIASDEPLLKRVMEDAFLSKDGLASAIACRLARKLGRNALREDEVAGIFMSAFEDDSDILESAACDISAIKSRDPACRLHIQPILYLKGFHAITSHRIANWLWRKNRTYLAYYFQSISSEVFAVDIHPAAKFGRGILLDHATSFVAGETSVVGDNVSILHEVTLGGTGNETGDRHPKVGCGVLIGAGAKLIGNITIGKCAKIGAGSVVLDDVPAHTTVVGVPARPTGITLEEEPALGMNQHLDCR